MEYLTNALQENTVIKYILLLFWFVFHYLDTHDIANSK